jgi:hypothetical protein
MKLSEAIRLGIGAVRNARMSFLCMDEDDDMCGCALGAAMYTMGYRTMEHDHEAFKEWPWLMPPIAYESPMGHERRYFRSTAHAISFLHLSQRMTREQIADWVETIEPTETPAPWTGGSVSAVQTFAGRCG